MPAAFSPLLSLPSSVWWPALAAMPLPLLWLVRAQGWLGKAMLRTTLRLLFPRARYQIRRNVTLRTADGPARIDLLVVSPHGIFVIAPTNRAGAISGRPSDDVWTQASRRRSVDFPNPLRRNYQHVLALAALTGIDERRMVSLVVFGGNATFKTPMPPNVTHLGGCVACIRAQRDVVLDDAQVAQVLARIDRGHPAPTPQTPPAPARPARDVHAQHAGARPALKAVAPAAGAATALPRAPGKYAPPPCPRCGGALGTYVYKTGAKAGRTFHGCTRFPECKFRTGSMAPMATLAVAA